MRAGGRRVTAPGTLSRSPVRAGFDLARSGNFPSVASNVLAALVLSDAAGAAWPSGGRLALTLVAGCLVYAGGATLNDVADAEFDARHRPERAIPRRIITRGTAAVIGAVEMTAGLGLLVAAGASVAWVGALAVAILAYDWIHKRWRGAVILMAGCRALLAGAIATLPGQAAGAPFRWWVGALFVYIVTLSLIARREYEPAPAAADGSPGRSTKTAGLGRLFHTRNNNGPHSVSWSRSAPAAVDERTTARAPWLPEISGLGRLVGRLLAFMPLVDALALLCVGAWIPAVACAAAIPLGRLAQRVAAST